MHSTIEVQYMTLLNTSQELAQESNLDKNFMFLRPHHQLQLFLTTNLSLRLQKIQRIMVKLNTLTFGTMPFIITFEIVKL